MLHGLDCRRHCQSNTPCRSLRRSPLQPPYSVPNLLWNDDGRSGLIPNCAERFQLVVINERAGSDAKNDQFDRQEQSGPEGNLLRMVLFRMLAIKYAASSANPMRKSWTGIPTPLLNVS